MPAPTVYSGSQFTPPVSYSTTPSEPKKSHTLLIALVVGFFALVAGGAVVGLVMYGLFSSGKKDTNVANVSNSADKSNKTISSEQKSGNDNPAQNLKEQQDKLAKDKQKLEAEKKEIPTPPQPPPNSRTATVIDPPTNIRLSPNGTILCVVKQRTTVNILGSTGVTDNNGTWYYTDACGRQGMIHSSQIRF